MKHTAITIKEGVDNDARLVPSGTLVPHLTVAAFCLTAPTRGAIERAAADRRLARVKTSLINGGIAQARRLFENKPTPSLLIVEVSTSGEALLKELASLAEVCDPTTKVVVIGGENDIDLYRTLMAQGIAEYIVGAITPLACVAMIQRLFGNAPETKLGKVFAFVGVKGGSGASTIAQNVALTMAEEQASPTLLLDLDFRFGSAAVNLDLKHVTGLEKYLSDPDKLDAALLDRLIVQRGEYLSVLPGFEDALGDVDPTPDAIERLIEIARASFPLVIIDMPHDWSIASRDTLKAADEVIVVASPDLPNLLNARALMGRLRAMRPNDAAPRVILNTCKMPRRKEIPSDQFAKSIGVEACATIAFDAATFGTAAAEGRAIRELFPRSKAQASIRHLVQNLTGPGKARTPGRLRRLLGLG